MDVVNRNLRQACPVCSKPVTGFHYGVMTCEGCKNFFRRAKRSGKEFECKANAQCNLVGSLRMCQKCRWQRCLEVGMCVDAFRMDGKRGGRRIEQMVENVHRKRPEVSDDDRSSKTSSPPSFISYSLAPSPNNTPFYQLPPPPPPPPQPLILFEMLPIPPPLFLHETISANLNCMDAFITSVRVLDKNFHAFIEATAMHTGFQCLDVELRNQMVSNSWLTVHILDFLYAISQQLVFDSYTLMTGRSFSTIFVALLWDQKHFYYFEEIVSILQNGGIGEVDYAWLRALILFDKTAFDVPIVHHAYESTLQSWKNQQTDHELVDLLIAVISRVKVSIVQNLKCNLAAHSNDWSIYGADCNVITEMVSNINPLSNTEFYQANSFQQYNPNL